MGRILLKWTVDKLVKTMVATLLNKFDCFTVIEGGTGIGKSTLAYKIAIKMQKEFKLLYSLDEKTIRYYYENVQEWRTKPVEDFINYILSLKEKRAYQFKPKRDLVYSQKEMLQLLSGWYRIGIPDEMINITFNRDFYGENQKNIIKMINMYRDHSNLILACVPQFQNLDIQVKNMTKLRLTVVRRGLAVIQTPNKTIHIKDKWDSATNEKIEREWLMKGNIGKPAYAKLTTTRGIIRFGALSKVVEDYYKKIKDDKRTKVAREEMGIKGEEKEINPEDMIYERLIKGGIRNGAVLDGMAFAIGLTAEQLRGRMLKRLEKENKPATFNAYFWDKKEKALTEISV